MIGTLAIKRDVAANATSWSNVVSNQSSNPPRHPGDEMSPNPYCESEPYQLRIWDQTALAGLMHCPRYHYLAQIRGLRAAGEAGSVDLDFGSFIHEAADVYAKARGAGADCELATEFAVEHALSATWPEDGQPWGGSYRTVWQCPDRTRAKKATKSAPAEKRCSWSKAEHLVSAVPGLEQVDGVPGTLRECPECRKGSTKPGCLHPYRQVQEPSHSPAIRRGNV